ncbi:hypothetical protein A71_194 [Escherichia phage A7_1]|uniref:Uncharacterized protein n=1 Tax=Escherichia phage A5-4 TaxID=2996162 RepID=A0A9Y1E2B1_9CAUD|nr:hypothetical protein A71_194 [Escherichia phage A7_1]UZZ64277.1 hypothetical protein A54_37 [Escherichia phage A5-4]
MRNVMKPEVKLSEAGVFERVIQTHPAYGLASITHPTGGNVEMFGSDTTHNQRVCLRIDTAYQEISYGLPSYYTSRNSRVIEIELTSYQWAELVASHSGQGVPITLRYIKGDGYVPGIEGQQNSSDMIGLNVDKDLKDLLKDHLEAVIEVQQLIEKGKATKKELTELKNKITRVHSKLPDITQHAINVFKENSEVVKAKAQAEFEASVNRKVVEAGLEALGIVPLQIGSTDD